MDGDTIFTLLAVIISNMIALWRVYYELKIRIERLEEKLNRCCSN